MTGDQQIGMAGMMTLDQRLLAALVHIASDQNAESRKLCLDAQAGIISALQRGRVDQKLTAAQYEMT